jgi:hypothetical protein
MNQVDELNEEFQAKVVKAFEKGEGMFMRISSDAKHPQSRMRISRIVLGNQLKMKRMMRMENLVTMMTRWE